MMDKTPLEVEAELRLANPGRTRIYDSQVDKIRFVEQKDIDALCEISFAYMKLREYFREKHPLGNFSKFFVSNHNELADKLGWRTKI